MSIGYECNLLFVLAPGACIVTVKNREAFAARYDTSAIELAPGVYAGSLSNGGEVIISY